VVSLLWVDGNLIIIELGLNMMVTQIL